MEHKILVDNFNAVNNSFTYYLHEEREFNKTAFKKYLQSIYSIATKSIHLPIDKNISYMIVKSYGFIMRCFIFHNNQSDLYQIENIPSYETTNKYIESMEIIVEEIYFNKKQIREDVLYF